MVFGNRESLNHPVTLLDRSTFEQPEIDDNRGKWIGRGRGGGFSSKILFSKEIFSRGLNHV